jgi:23S rRNA pseudouridine1911/1915/1917 synthase
LAIGIFNEKDGYINYPLTRAKTFGKFRRAKQDELAEGLKTREAHTEYHVLHEYKNKYSFLKVVPLTGRTHQIRVHLLTIGRPVAGDKVYGSNLDDLGLKRQFLHASRLNFTLDNIHYSFFAPLPQDLIEVLQKIAG